MHRSRIGVVLIDHPEETYAAGAAFWAGVTGSPRSAADASPGAEPYESLDSLPGGVLVELQRTGAGTPARIHLDIETDDVAAEVARVLALGARVVERREGYVILADPGGLLFCAVPVQTGADFEGHAQTWP
ncbi:MAG: VOC family protein [Tetrasphaera sp.]